MAGQDEIELALKLYRRALALSRVRSGSARLSQLELEKSLVADAHSMTSAHFLLRYPEITEKRYASQLVGVLEQEWRRLQQWVPLAHPQRVKVDLFPVEAFLRVYSVGVPVLGIFDGRVRVPLADLHSLRPLLISILSHELAHALITERTHDHASKWLQEGLAQHIQMSDQSVNPFPELVHSGHQLSLPVVEAALAGFSDPQFVDIAYGQALWTVHFIEARWGRAGLGRLLDAYAAGAVGEEPLVKTFGLGYAEFDRALWAWAVDKAPSTWPTELRRYDQEAERAELTRTDSQRPLAVVAPPPLRDPLQTRNQAMQSWYAAYTARVRELGPIIAVYRRDARQDVTASCRALSGGLVGLLEDPRLLNPPDQLVGDPLRRAYWHLRELATACQSAEGRTALGELDSAERALGEAAAAMKRWNLTP